MSGDENLQKADNLGSVYLVINTITKKATCSKQIAPVIYVELLQSVIKA
jgi:hypothetical protein